MVLTQVNTLLLPVKRFLQVNVTDIPTHQAMAKIVRPLIACVWQACTQARPGTWLACV